MRHMSILRSAAVAVLLLTARDVSAALTVDYDVTGNELWTAADGPVTVTKVDFAVAEGGTLTLGAGVEVDLVPASGDVTVNGTLLIRPGAVVRCYETVQVVVYGTVIVRGSADSTVTFDEYETGRGWNGFYFRNGGTLHTSSFRHAAFNNQSRGTAVTEQDVTFDSCSFVSGNFGDDLFLRTWGGLVRVEGARLTVRGSRFSVAGDYDCGGFGCDRTLVQLDGMDAVIEDNEMEITASGANIETVNGIIGLTSNTEPFTATVRGNAVSIVSRSGFVLCTAYGVNFSEWSVTGVIDGNSIDIRTATDGCGVYGYDGAPVTDNDIRVVKTASGNGSLYGIRSQYTGNDSTERITGNRVVLATAADSVTSYSFTGIYMQSGAVRNNAVRIRYTAPAGGARMYGVEKCYYRGLLENNSISITHAGTGDAVTGVYLGTHPNADDSIPVVNNIVAGSGIDGSRGIYRSGDCASLPVNRYNLVYGFAEAHDGLDPGPGLATADPLFADSTLRLGLWSPAVDAGDPAMDWSREPEPDGDRINMGAYGNTPDAMRSVTDSFTVTAVPLPDSGGTVYGAGAYWYGDTARLAAVPETGFRFTGWSAGTLHVSGDTAYAFEVTRSCTLAAVFGPVSGIATPPVPVAGPSFRIITAADGFVRVRCGAAGTVALADVAGNVVARYGAQESVRVDVRTLPRGFYVVHTTTAAGTASATYGILKL